jgi:hypothetical protein
VNLKSIRIVRLMKPLRGMTSVPAMRRQVGALIRALPDFANVGVFLIFMFFLFATLGLY